MSVEDLDAVERRPMIPAQNDVDEMLASARGLSAGRSEDIHPSGVVIAAETKGISGYSSYSGIDSIDICDEEASLSVVEGVGGVLNARTLRDVSPLAEC